jgi:hypothetical protein
MAGKQRRSSAGKKWHRSLTDYKRPEMFKITDPATRDLVKGCIPALLVSAAVTVALAIAIWWWVSK